MYMVYEQNVVSIKKACAKRVKLLLFIAEYANLSRILIAVVVVLFLVCFQTFSI